MKSKLIANRKKSTILVSKRTVEDAQRRANALAGAWMQENPNDPRLDELQRIVDHLSSILSKGPQQLTTDGASTVEDYFDDAKMPEVAATVKREVSQIAKWHNDQRPARTTPQDHGVQYAPDSAVYASDAKDTDMNKDKKANGASFVTDRNEQGEPKAPETAEVPRLAAKKKEAVPEVPAAAAPLPVAAPAAAPAALDTQADITQLSSEALAKAIKALTGIKEFETDKAAQAFIEQMAMELKNRPVEPEEPAAAPAAAPVPAAAAPIPVAASKKKADDDNNKGSDIANTAINLGGLLMAASEEKTAEEYRVHDFKVDEGGIRPSGKLPDMDTQEQQMSGENDLSMEASEEKEAGIADWMNKGHDKDDDITWDYIKQHSPEERDKAGIITEGPLDLGPRKASGNSGGAWSSDQDKGDVVEDGGRTPEIGEAHGLRDDNTGISHPTTTPPIKLAADMTTSKAVKQSEQIGNDLKKMYLSAKSLTQVNDNRAVREAVESIFRAADMFDEATKTLNKQLQQEESEAAAQEIKAKNKKSSLFGLALAAAE